MSMLTLNVVTLEDEVFSGETTCVVVNATQGDLGVFPGHAPLLAEISPGPLHYYVDGKVQILHTSGGIIEVKNNIVSILADKCIRAEDIDEARLKEAALKAQQLLSEQESTKTIIQARAELIKTAALARSLKELRRLRK